MPAALPPTWKICWAVSGCSPTAQQSGATLATALLKNGSTVSAECAAFRGSSANPMSREERLVKLRDCFHRALSQDDTERVLEMLENLEEVGGRGRVDGGLGAGGGFFVKHKMIAFRI